MSYSNRFLRDFCPVFLAILKEKNLNPAGVELEIIDEEPEGRSIFEPVGVKEVLEQLAEELNFLTIYTERPAYFYDFAETMYEENGLVVMIFPKDKMRDCKKTSSTMQICSLESESYKKDNAADSSRVILDFEWEGGCRFEQMRQGRYYIPIHKKPWEMGENLDIIVPIGYNTVIVKGMQNNRKKPERDRFEEAFYNL